MPLNVPMIIYGLDLKGWSRSHNMKRISVPFKRASRKVPRRLVLPVVPKTQNPSPKEKVKVKERKEEVRIPKESPRARVAIKPERAKTTKREIVAPRATRTVLKDLATRTQVTRVFASFGPKVFVGVERIAPISMKVQEHLHQLKRHRLVWWPVQLRSPFCVCCRRLHARSRPGGTHLRPWILGFWHGRSQLRGSFYPAQLSGVELTKPKLLFSPKAATAKGALLLAVSCWLKPTKLVSTSIFIDLYHMFLTHAQDNMLTHTIIMSYVYIYIYIYECVCFWFYYVVYTSVY